MDLAVDLRRQRNAMLVVPGGQKLRFQFGDIDSRRTFAGAGFTRQAEIEDLFYRGIAEVIW